MTYSSLFKCKRIHTYLLQDEYILQRLIEQGYIWIRRYDDISFHNLIRYPTTGCIVELFTTCHAGCVPILSPKSKKLIYKLCYF